MEVDGFHCGISSGLHRTYHRTCCLNRIAYRRIGLVEFLNRRTVIKYRSAKLSRFRAVTATVFFIVFAVVTKPMDLYRAIHLHRLPETTQTCRVNNTILFFIIFVKNPVFFFHNFLIFLFCNCQFSNGDQHFGTHPRNYNRSCSINKCINNCIAGLS